MALQDLSQSPGYICCTCGKSFTSRSKLTSHEIIHTNIKPFECTQCGKKFNRSYNLQLHLRSHSTSKTFLCTACDSTFTQSSSLYRHITTKHFDQRLHQCDRCEKSFKLASHLSRHLENVHHLASSRAPLECSQCFGTFRDAFDLRVHMRSHSLEKPYSCSVCSKTFSRLSNAAAHNKRVHELLNCLLCDRKFKSLSKLQEHLEKHSETELPSNDTAVSEKPNAAI